MAQRTNLIPYIRRSRKNEEVVSLEDQRRAIREWAERNNAELLDFVEEPLGTSGAIYWRDRQVGDILKRLDAGEADGVIVAYFSRLSRGKYSETFELLEELEPFTRVSAKTGRVKKPGEDIDIVDVIETWQARDEFKTLGRHLVSGKHESWREGISTAAAPAGYDAEQYVTERGKVKRRPLAPSGDTTAIRKAFELRAAGHPWVAVAQHLTSSGVMTYIAKRDSKARPWTTQATRALIANPIYRGEWSCNCGCGGKEVRTDLAIVTRTLWNAAQPVVRRGIGRGKGERAPRQKSLLAGLLRCGTCGKKMALHPSRASGKTYFSYTCSNQFCEGKAAIARDGIEEFVVTAALDYWLETQPKTGTAKNPRELIRLEVERDQASSEVEAFVLNTPASLPGYAQGLAARQAVFEEAADALAAEQAKRDRERINPKAARAAALQAMRDETALEDRAELRRVISRVLAAAVIEPHGAKSRHDVRPVRDRTTLDFKALAF